MKKGKMKMSLLKSISPSEFTILAIVIGLIAISLLDSDELDTIGNWLIGIGSLMVIASSQADYLNTLEEKRSREDNLRKQIELLHEELSSFAKGKHHS